MTMLKRLFSICSLLALAACGGGGGDAGTPPFGGGPGGGGTTGPTATDLVLVLSSDSVSNSGTATVTATVTALDANRNALADVPVTITADSDAVVTLATASTVTNASGVLTATISIGSNRTNRTIIVSAKSGTIAKTANLSVVTASQPVPTASDISLVISAPVIPNSGNATVTATVTAVDSNRNTIAGIPITLRVDSDATIAVSSGVTNSAGVVSGVISTGPNKANRPIRVTALSGTLSRESVVQVTGTKVAATALPAVIAPGQTGKVQYRVTDAGNAPIADFVIRVVGPGGVASQATTDNSGSYEFSYVAPQGNQTLNIQASSGGVDTNTNIIVQATSGAIPAVDPVANPIGSASVRANPSVVAINATANTDNVAQIRALFVTTANRPIQNIRVRFQPGPDPNNVGGTIASGTTMLYSDINGIAQTNYRPGSRSSPTDGVTIRACWSYEDFTADQCPQQVTTTLTVIEDALSVTIGTDNIIVISEDLVYIQRFVVQVNDSSGLAKADVAVNPILDLTAYHQGFWSRAEDDDRWRKRETASDCGNEDVNRNGLLEVYPSNGHVEDANNNRQLDPRKADVIVAYEDSNVTNSSGRITFRIIYPRNVASWIDYAISVAATGISGTEGRASFEGTLAVPEPTVRAEAVPPFVVSPYGQDFNPPRTRVTVPTDPAPQRTAVLCVRPPQTP